MLKLRLLFAAAAVFTLSACLGNDVERGLAGAAAGAIIADSTGGNVVTGAALGGLAGATGDEFTSICR
ncbi:MAG: hypothetical protein COB65_13520 [Thalassobium sp.]|nr:MAG: hypothetical protein COB65_13520 [Thalassobium sp.]